MADKPGKILFMTAPIGSGHTRAAQALSQAVCRLRPDIQTSIANIFDFIHPFVGKFILKIYMKVLQVIPSLYGLAYKWGNSNHSAVAGREWISCYLARKMEHFLLDNVPDVIICTHATPAGLAAWLHKHNKLRIPTVAVITDYTVHRLWVYTELDYYFVADDILKECLIRSGIDSRKIRTTGIPVAAPFSECRKKSETMVQPFRQTKTLLIMGGGAGVMPMDKILLACDEVSIPLRIVAITGNNVEMLSKLNRLKNTIHHDVTVLGFVDNVDDYMAQADLIISKPGGMTSAEALCLGLPMLIYKPIPGQEEANTKYLVQHNAAKRIDSVAKLQTTLTRLLKQKPGELGMLQRNARFLGKPEAAERIAKHILSLLPTTK